MHLKLDDVPASNSLQATVNRRIAPHVPKRAWNSTVAIVIANRPAVHLLGTGSLFQIADSFFVVTARHVVTTEYDYDKTIGISGDLNLIATPGTWILSVSNSGEDPFDLAIYPLPTAAIQRLTHFRVLHISDIDFDGNLGPRYSPYSATQAFGPHQVTLKEKR